MESQYIDGVTRYVPVWTGGFWNYLMAYVGHQEHPGQSMRVLHRVCLDWGAFIRTTGWHGLDAATDAGTTYGIGKSMRAAEGAGDTV
jgi:hypothetical protein